MPSKWPALQVVVPGIPRPKGSLKVWETANGPVVTHDNVNLKDWMEDVAWSAQDEMQKHRRQRLQGPVALVVTFYLPRPKSLAKSVLSHIKKPDLDKLARGANDALTGVVFEDDRQVVEIHCYKRYAVGEPMTVMTISEVEV